MLFNSLVTQFGWQADKIIKASIQTHLKLQNNTRGCTGVGVLLQVILNMSHFEGLLNDKKLHGGLYSFEVGFYNSGLSTHIFPNSY